MPEGFTPKDDSPFHPALEKDVLNDDARDRTHRIQGIESRDDVLVRVERVHPKSEEDEDELQKLRGAYHDNPNNQVSKERRAYHEKLDEYYSLDDVKVYREHLALLKEKYGVSNSGYFPVIGANPEDDIDPARLYIVTNRLTGISPETDRSSIPLSAEKALFEKILHYYHDIYFSGGFYLDDLNIEQFMYDPRQDEMILVDVETLHIDEAFPISRIMLIDFKNKLEFFIRAMRLDHPDEFTAREAQALRARIEETFRPS